MKFSILNTKNKKKLSDQKIYEILKEFNIATYINREVNDMSGGERQRIELIRTIIVGSPIIICDEPTTGLDEENTDFFIKTVKLIAKSLQKIVIIVTHDKKISEIGDVKYVIKNNKIEKRVV
jgi:ABC-type lipoprotein export system ATPase subunit